MAVVQVVLLLTINFLHCYCTTYSNIGDHTLVSALEDDFSEFNLSLWKHEITLSGGGNWEFEAYLNNRSSSYVRDGVLYIKPILMEDQIGVANLKSGFDMDIWGGSPADLCTQNQFYGCFRTSGAGGNYLNPIKSARIRTAESFFFRYGKVEVRAKLPRGDWLWPAIWMLPRYEQYGTWPASGEIDIMESRGNAPSYPPGGYNSFTSTLHWGPDYTHNNYEKTHASMTGVDLTADFHIYGFIWNETYMGTYFDDESNVVLSVPITQSFWSQTGLKSPPWDNPWVGRGNNAPFDQEFYLIINLACGGTNGYFPDGYGKPWNNGDPHAVNSFYNNKAQWYSTWDGENSALQIDSVRVWKYIPSNDGNVVVRDHSQMPMSMDSGCITSPLFLFLVLLSAVITIAIYKL